MAPHFGQRSPPFKQNCNKTSLTCRTLQQLLKAIFCPKNILITVKKNAYTYVLCNIMQNNHKITSLMICFKFTLNGRCPGASLEKSVFGKCTGAES